MREFCKAALALILAALYSPPSNAQACDPSPTKRQEDAGSNALNQGSNSLTQGTAQSSGEKPDFTAVKAAADQADVKFKQADGHFDKCMEEAKASIKVCDQKMMERRSIIKNKQDSIRQNDALINRNQAHIQSLIPGLQTQLAASYKAQIDTAKSQISRAQNATSNLQSSIQNDQKIIEELQKRKQQTRQIAERCHGIGKPTAQKGMKDADQMRQLAKQLKVQSTPHYKAAKEIIDSQPEPKIKQPSEAALMGTEKPEAFKPPKAKPPVNLTQSSPTSRPTPAPKPVSNMSSTSPSPNTNGNTSPAAETVASNNTTPSRPARVSGGSSGYGSSPSYASASSPTPSPSPQSNQSNPLGNLLSALQSPSGGGGGSSSSPSASPSPPAPASPPQAQPQAHPQPEDGDSTSLANTETDPALDLLNGNQDTGGRDPRPPAAALASTDELHNDESLGINISSSENSLEQLREKFGDLLSD